MTLLRHFIRDSARFCFLLRLLLRKRVLTPKRKCIGNRGPLLRMGQLHQTYAHVPVLARSQRLQKVTTFSIHSLATMVLGVSFYVIQMMTRLNMLMGLRYILAPCTTRSGNHCPFRKASVIMSEPSRDCPFIRESIGSCILLL